MPELIHEHIVHVRTPEGKAFVPRTFAERQVDGTWEAWLEFDSVDGQGPTLRTDRETSQATRQALEVWASGLEAVYFEGAFERARPMARVPFRAKSRHTANVRRTPSTRRAVSVRALPRHGASSRDHHA